MCGVATSTSNCERDADGGDVTDAMRECSGLELEK